MVLLSVWEKDFTPVLADIEEMASWGGKVSRVVAPLLDFFARANQEVFGFDGAPLHDALAVAHLIRPEVIRPIPSRHLPQSPRPASQALHQPRPPLRIVLVLKHRSLRPICNLQSALSAVL